MIRNIKALGLALVAVFAISAMAASAAQAGAPDFTAAAYPATVKATRDGTGVQTFHAAIGNIKCEEVGGTAVLAGASNELTSESLSYTGCKALNTFPATVHTNGCKFKFTVEETETATTSKGTVHLICPGTPASITITVFEAGTVPSEHGNAAKRTCILHIPGGQTIHGIKYHNITTESGRMHVTVETNTGAEIEDTHEGSLCGTGTSTTDTYTGNIIASAENGLSESIDSTIADTP